MRPNERRGYSSRAEWTGDIDIQSKERFSKIGFVEKGRSGLIVTFDRR